MAWLCARSSGSRFLVRMEDLDPMVSRREHEVGQLRDLRDIGLDWDGEVVRQSERFGLYRDALTRLVDLGVVYECFCTRREIFEATQAPNGGTSGVYPGTCRNLTQPELGDLRLSGRPPALRLQASAREMSVVDRLVGTKTFPVDDIVLRRNDGLYAYNLAVVVDDHEQGIEEVVRGDDLLSSAASQMHLGDVLGYERMQYVHVPLAVTAAGNRLAKRDGAVTLSDRQALGESGADVLRRIAFMLGFVNGKQVQHPSELIEQFSIAMLPTKPWIFQA